MESFYDNHSEILKDDALKAGTAVLTETRESLGALLDGTQVKFLEHHSKHKDTILAQLSQNNHAAYQLVQSWLANDFGNLPRPIVSHLFMTLEVSINGKDPSRGYNAWRTVSSSTEGSKPFPQEQDASGDHVKKIAKGVDGNNSSPLHFSYTFQIETDGLEFWNYRRSVGDVGVKDLMLPIGMKEPMSERIKQSFKFGMGKDSEVSKEPEFVKADNYSLVKIVLEGDRTLSLQLSEDPEKRESPIIRITFDVKSLTGESSSPRAGNPPQQHQISASLRPRIDYIMSQENTGELPVPATDLLQGREIEAASDLSKINLLGSAVLSKMMKLQERGLLGSRGALRGLRVSDVDVVTGSNQGELNYVDKFFDLLESIASSFAPPVRKMKETTPVQGELMIRQDLGGGQRKEFSIRIDEITSQLDKGENGKRIKSALGL